MYEYVGEGRLERTVDWNLVTPRRHARRLTVICLSLVLLGGLCYALWRLPIWQVDQAGMGLAPADRLTAENELRRTLATIVAGFVVALTVVAALWNAKTAQDNLKATREGQITDRFSRAVELLGVTTDDGSPSMETRIGAIFALERIGADSPRDYWQIVEILTAYVRQHAPWPFLESGSQRLDSLYRRNSLQLSDVRPRPDIQAAITVLGRRKDAGFEIDTLDLNHVDLRGYNLTEAVLHQAQLVGSSLSGANLYMVDLTGAHLQDADLSRASLWGTRLVQANLRGADLSDCEGTEHAGLRQIVVDERTKLPPGVDEQLKARLRRAADQHEGPRDAPCAGKVGF